MPEYWPPDAEEKSHIASRQLRAVAAASRLLNMLSLSTDVSMVQLSDKTYQFIFRSSSEVDVVAAFLSEAR